MENNYFKVNLLQCKERSKTSLSWNSWSFRSGILDEVKGTVRTKDKFLLKELTYSP